MRCSVGAQVGSCAWLLRDTDIAAAVYPECSLLEKTLALVAQGELGVATSIDQREVIYGVVQKTLVVE